MNYQPTFCWYVQGETHLKGTACPTLFAHKIDAERHARELFPQEDAVRRYSRIFYKELHGGAA